MNINCAVLLTAGQSRPTRRFFYDISINKIIKLKNYSQLCQSSQIINNFNFHKSQREAKRQISIWNTNWKTNNGNRRKNNKNIHQTETVEKSPAVGPAYESWRTRILSQAGGPRKKKLSREAGKHLCIYLFFVVSNSTMSWGERTT